MSEGAEKAEELAGGCLCGAVRFTARPPFSDAYVCHCSQCARWSGMAWPSVEVRAENLNIENAEALQWFASSAHAQRGFCSVCGSSLFWRRNDGEVIDVALGALDGHTGLRLSGHINVADKSDFYDIEDGLPQWPHARPSTVEESQ